MADNIELAQKNLEEWEATGARLNLSLAIGFLIEELRTMKDQERKAMNTHQD